MKPNDHTTPSASISHSLAPYANTDTVKTIDRIFKARSIAVVGASSDPAKFGYMTLDCLIRGGYEGTVFPINPKGGEILGLRVYPSLNEVPGQLDLAMIIVPFQFVASVLQEAAKKNVAGAIICSGGFKEAGRQDLEDELKAIGRQTGVRLLGPNISGIAYLPNKMCAQFFPAFTTRGPLAVICQSGTVTTGLCEWASDDGLGVSAGINLGNQVDLCECDYLDFFARDENTRAIVMYLEGVSNGRRFLETLDRTTPRKPVVIIKGGRTEAGRRSTASHTGSMASSHEIFSAACRQVGALVAPDIETAYDHAKALATMRPIQGRRLLSISTSGGANTLAMDEIEAHGLEVLKLPTELVAKLKGLGLSPLAGFPNPIDLVSIRADDFRKVVLEVDQHNLADVILLNFGDPVVGDLELVKELNDKIKASVAVSYFAGGSQEKIGRIALSRAGFPVFAAPERAIRGIAAKAWYSNYLQKRGLR
jgi:acyl-CoA synthetase (NDP forming)